MDGQACACGRQLEGCVWGLLPGAWEGAGVPGAWPPDLASSWAGTTGVPLPKFKPQVLEVTSSCPLSLLWNLNNIYTSTVPLCPYLENG